MAASPFSGANPFTDSIHANPWVDPKSNVPEIGREAFDILQAEIAAVRQFHRSRSLLIYGAPGCGKTHLIARTRMFLADQSSRRWLDNVFVSVQMHTAPARMWRHIRHRLMEDLLRVSSNGRSQMDSLLFRILAAPGSRGTYLDIWKQDISPEADEFRNHPLAAALFAIVTHLERSGALQQMDGELVHQLDGEQAMSPALRTILLHLAYRRHLGNAHAWLRGESLSNDAMETLGVSRPDDEDPEGEARDFVLSILRLIGPGTPVVFCFDQTEALQSEPGDITGFFAFGNAVSALHDIADNAVLVAFVQSLFVDIFKGALGSHFDRISEKMSELPGLTPAQAAPLIQARMQGLTGAQAALIKLEDFADLFEKKGLATPRRIIARAAQLFDKASEGTVDQVLAARLELLLESAQSTAGVKRADDILEHGLPILLRLSGGKPKSSAATRDVQITFSGKSGLSGISVCNQENMNSLGARLRRLKAGTVLPSNLVLVRDGRLPISRSARKTVEHLDELTGKKARLVRASPEIIAALDALRLLITAAHSGDLAHDGNAIESRKVEEWLAANLPAVLTQFSSDVMGNSAVADSALQDQLLELLAGRYLLPLNDAADSLKVPAAEIAACAGAGNATLGYLAGPPALLFQRLAETGI